MTSKVEMVNQTTKHLTHPYAPQNVTDLLLAFPANVAHLMPEWNWDIGREWKSRPEAKTWLEFQSDWFFNGLRSDLQVAFSDGIDGATALRHLAAIQGSYEPKHEAKEFAVAFLASQWFERILDADGNVLYGTLEEGA